MTWEPAKRPGPLFRAKTVLETAGQMMSPVTEKKGNALMLGSKQLFASAALVVLLVSCGSGPDADEAPAGVATSAMNDPDNPFATSEMEMNDKMMAAVGANVSDTWAKQMIEHHRGAIAMSEVVLTLNPTTDVRTMAQQTISKQGKEVEQLTKMLSTSPADPASLEPYRSANMTMHDGMMAAKGADASETYLRKMVAHHRGAVALSDVVLAKGSEAKIREIAQKTKTDQAKEAGMIEAMLAGEPMPMGSSASIPAAKNAHLAPSAKPSASKPATKTTPVPAKPAPLKPTPAPAAAPTTDPHAGMKM